MDDRERLRNLLASAAERRLSQNTDSTSQPILHMLHQNQNETVSIQSAPECCAPLPPLRSNTEHLVLVHHDLLAGTIPKPYPESYVDRWDENHVRLPCSPSNLSSSESVWERIRQSFRQPIANANELERVILSANPEMNPSWSFETLNDLLANDPGMEDFFTVVLPNMIRLALQLPAVLTQPIPLLARHRSRSITLSQQQIASLLANAFFCTFPSRSNGSPEFRFYPTINFEKLYALTRGPRSRCKKEKLKCLINYFRRVTNEIPTGLVTFRRRYLSSFPNWSDSCTSLRVFSSHSEGSIELDGIGLLQMDFANKRVGGGVLNTGCVQEEIRFVLFPELIVARIFSQALDDGEVLLITGCEKFNSHSGYGDHFRWAGDYRDTTITDAWGRRMTQVVAADATRFIRPDVQYKTQHMLRELNKVYCAFDGDGVDPDHLTAVATGNWGCGAYRGDSRLKTLLQLMAASEAGRDVVYYTFGDAALRNELQEMCDFLRERKVTVGSLWTVLLRYEEECMSRNDRPSLYQHVRNSFSNGGDANN